MFIGKHTIRVKKEPRAYTLHSGDIKGSVSMSDVHLIPNRREERFEKLERQEDKYAHLVNCQDKLTRWNNS